MTPPVNYIVFLCYGNERVFHECMYALLSFSRLYTAAELSNIQIWIYTDDAARFRSFRNCPLPLFYREVDKGIIKQWRGKIDFVHRVKVEMLKDFTREWNGNIIYVDTDVVFTNRIDKMFHDIKEGKLYMHTMEGIVNRSKNPVFRKLSKYLGSTRELNGKHLNEMAMWNAGVLGFNTKYSYLLDEVLAFTDSEYPNFSKHIVEQFACSVYFQQTAVVKAAAPYIFHYWNLKEAAYVLGSFFEYFKDKNWDELAQYSSLLQMHALMQIKVDFLHNRSATGSILHKQWRPAIPDWGELMKQL
jgi:hypothetical protein